MTSFSSPQNVESIREAKVVFSQDRSYIAKESSILFKAVLSILESNWSHHINPISLDVSAHGRFLVIRFKGSAFFRSVMPSLPVIL